MKVKQIVKELRAEAKQLNRAADMIEGSVKKGGPGRPPKVATQGTKRRGRPPKKKVEEPKS